MKIYPTQLQSPQPKTYNMTLQNIIKKLKFAYVSPDITDANFPLEKIRGEIKLFHFKEYMTSEEVINAMDKDGYVPANLYELLAYAKNGWDNAKLVIALGSVWQVSGGFRFVPGLGGDAGGRDLRLGRFDVGWGSDYRFAAVRKYQKSETTTLSTDLDTLTLRISSLESDMEKIKKFLII